MKTAEQVQAFWFNMDDEEYERRVQEWEDKGVCRSDAQAIVEAEMMQE